MRRCDARDQAETIEAVAGRESLPASGYGPRGAALRAAMADADGIGPLQLVLLDEAARIADRLDRLDATLERKGEWLRAEPGDDGSVVVVVDNALGEARQQAATLKALVAEIRAALPKPAVRRQPVVVEKPDGGGLGDLVLLAGGR